MKKILLFSFLAIGIFMIYAEEPDEAEIPSKYYTGEITFLGPYPVTTRSSRTPKAIYLLEQHGNKPVNVRVIVCYSNGQSIQYTTNDEGRIMVNSSRQINKIFILERGEGSDDSL